MLATKRLTLRLATALLCLASSFAIHAAPALDEAVATLAQRWARAYYVLPEAEQGAAFKSLASDAQQLIASNPGVAEPLVWHAIVLASQAELDGGLSALGKAKQARELLLAAEKINPKAAHGAIYTTLAELYSKVPGWPIGFGDNKKARQYFETALKANPQGLGENYFYGEFLADQGEYAAAQARLEASLTAAIRPNMAEADTARRKAAQLLLEEVHHKLATRP